MLTSFNNDLYVDESLLLDVWNKRKGGEDQASPLSVPLT